MTRFVYDAVTTEGGAQNGTIRSASRRDAILKLRELGYFPVSVEEAGAQHGPRVVRAFQGRIGRHDLAVFTRQLGALVRAGLPLPQALATLGSQTRKKNLRIIIEELRLALASDAAMLSEALAAHPRVFGPVYCGLVRSGEESGRLHEALEELADYVQNSARLRAQVIGAFLYPSFLLVAGTVAVFVLVSFVLPQFEKLFDSFDQQLPLITRVLIGVSGLLSAWWWAFALLMVVVGVGGATALSREWVRERIDTSVLRLPLAGSLLLKIELARMARTLGSLLGSGVRMTEAMRITTESVQNRSVRASMARCRAGLASGASLAEMMMRERVFPPLLVNLVRTGELTSQLPGMLRELTKIYDEEASRATAGAVKLLEPMLILIFGLLIAGIVAGVMLPIFLSTGTGG